jgi:hypothetical protein
MSKKRHTHLADRVPGVVDNQSMWIRERGGRFVERHPVLPLVAGGFLRVPFEGESHMGKLGVLRSVGYAPNDMLISCKRPVITYGPLLPPGASSADERGPARVCRLH